MSTSSPRALKANNKRFVPPPPRASVKQKNDQTPTEDTMPPLRPPLAPPPSPLCRQTRSNKSSPPSALAAKFSSPTTGKSPKPVSPSTLKSHVTAVSPTPRNRPIEAFATAASPTTRKRPAAAASIPKTNVKQKTTRDLSPKPTKSQPPFRQLQPIPMNPHQGKGAPPKTLPPIPHQIMDPRTQSVYKVGDYMGKGAFARCHAVQMVDTRQVLACKMIPQSFLVKNDIREKVFQEIMIHRSLSHEFIVGFKTNFEDSSFVYMLLELCEKRSLMELQRRRVVITEPEARYFLKQIVTAVDYLHEQRVIHRDMKLGNIFITKDIRLKIGDFGLATIIDSNSDRKRTLCGTPNYIAPEVLAKTGHSFEVDIWSIGCILYTLLVGKPPFETQTLRDTYRKIKRAEFDRPKSHKTSAAAREIIEKTLQVDPTKRPTPKQILLSDFLTKGILPTSLPTSVLTTAPKFARNTCNLNSPSANTPSADSVIPKPLTPAAAEGESSFVSEMSAAFNSISKRVHQEQQEPQRSMMTHPAKPKVELIDLSVSHNNNSDDDDESSSSAAAANKSRNNVSVRTESRVMKMLSRIVKIIIAARPTVATDNDCDSESPSLSPMLWMLSWVDYSDKHGFGYQLSDDSIGVVFKDGVKILRLPPGENSDTPTHYYIDTQGNETYFESQMPSTEPYASKMRLFTLFTNYIKTRLVRADGRSLSEQADIDEVRCIARVPSICKWVRTPNSLIVALTNGTVQINKLDSHYKYILCPLLNAITVIHPDDQQRRRQVHRTFKLDSLLSCASHKMINILNDVAFRIQILVQQPTSTALTHNNRVGTSPSRKSLSIQFNRIEHKANADNNNDTNFICVNDDDE